MMSNAGSAALSLPHGLRGPVFSVASACEAASHALGTALRMIQHGEAEAVVTGGAEALALGERAEQIPVRLRRPQRHVVPPGRVTVHLRHPPDYEGET
jgi:acetyl-CoA acetyltransferase